MILNGHLTLISIVMLMALNLSHQSWAGPKPIDQAGRVSASVSPDDATAAPIRVARAFLDALNTADTDALLVMFTPDATVFGPFSDKPARIQGQKAIARLFGAFFEELRETEEGPRYMNLTPRDLLAQTYGDTAVVTFHLGVIPEGPPDRDYSFSRRTLVMTRSADHWLIAHLHASNIMIPAATCD